jgi:hypothetical protein
MVYKTTEYDAVAQADKDILMSFVASHVTLEGAVRYLFTSNNHYTSNKPNRGDSITVKIDADSVIDCTSSSSGEAWFFGFNHNSHPYTYAEIAGKLNVTYTNTALTKYQFVRDNNPSRCQITIANTAKIKLDFATESSALTAYFVAFWTGGGNKLDIDLSTITENGALTLDGISLYYASASTVPQVYFTADVNTNDLALGLKAVIKWSDTLTETTVAAGAYTEANGIYYYSSDVAKLLPLVTDGGTIWVIGNVVQSGETFISKTLTIASPEGSKFTVTTQAMKKHRLP